MATINSMLPQIADRADQVISMTDLRRNGRELIDRLSNGDQGKYLIRHDDKIVYAILPIGGDLNLNHEGQVISATDLLRNGKELLNRLKNSEQKRFLVVRRNRPVGVLIRIDDDILYGMEITMYEIEATANSASTSTTPHPD